MAWPLLGFRPRGAQSSVIGSEQNPGDVSPSPADPPIAPPVVDAAQLPAPVAPGPPRKRFAVVRRGFEWIWQGRAMKELRAAGRIGSPRALELLRRAWRAVELAERALAPVPKLTNGAADAEARELLCQALYWGLAAEAVLKREAGESGSAVDATSLLALWAHADRSLLATAAGGEANVHALEVALRVERFADFAELPAEEQARQARDLLVFVRGLLTALETPRVRLDRLWLRRIVRSTGLVVLIAVITVSVLLFRAHQERSRDLAIGRPYKTSSVYPGVGCKSPEQDCPESPFYFFHTMDDDRPWIEFDLGGKRRVSAIKLVNREDCCAERAAPLAVEVSMDDKTWREVARRTEVFNTWYKEFPTVSARYVRVIGLHKSPLHLKRVAILR